MIQPTVAEPILRHVAAADAAAIATIYNHYILNTVVTFEEEPVTIEEMSHRIEAIRNAGLPWLVAVDQNAGGKLAAEDDEHPPLPEAKYGELIRDAERRT